MRNIIAERARMDRTDKVGKHSDDTRTSIVTAALFRVRDLFAPFGSASVARPDTDPSNSRDRSYLVG